MPNANTSAEFKGDNFSLDYNDEPSDHTDARLTRDKLLASIPRSLMNPVGEDARIRISNSKKVCYYTRYSTVSQSELSTVRQIEDSDKYIKFNSFELTKDGIYSDEGRSGFYMAGRDRLAALLERVRKGDVFAVIIADPSRLARDMVDLGWLYRQLKRLGVELHAASCGRMDQAKVAMFGFLNETQVQSLVHNTRHARRAMVLDSRVPWGARVFGYEKDGNVGGKLKVNNGEAAIVRRIFELVIAGVAYARIAAILNASAKFRRNNKQWSADSVSRVIRNLLYRGLIVYGRNLWKRDHDTLCCQKKPAPTDDWVISFATHLVIVTEDVWNNAQRAQLISAVAPSERRHRRNYLLSELVYCPKCDKHMVCLGSPAGAEARRFVCSGHVYNRSCGNGRSWDMGWIETATLRLLAKILNDVALYGPYLESLAIEANKATAAAVAERSRLKRQLLEAQEDLDGTFDKSRMAGYSQKSIERIRRVKEADVERTEDALARIVSPRAAIDVGRRIEELGGLAAALREISTANAIDTMTEEGAKLAAAIRALISRLVPTPDPASHGVSVTLTLAEMAFYDAGAVTCEGPVRVVRGTYVPPTKEEQRLAKGQAEVEEHLSTGSCILDENAWCSIRQNLPEGITSRLDGELRDGRALVDATILALRLRRPFADLPMAYGSRKPLRNAIKALVSSGAWFQIATTLKKLAPHMLEGVDANRFDYFLKKYKRISGGAPARRRRDIIIQLLRRTEGATLDEIRAATGQTAGVVRSAVCRLKRLDLQVVRFKRADETRAWRLTTV